MRIVQVNLNDELEYFIEFYEEETFSAEDLKRFLERRSSESLEESDYVRRSARRGLAALTAIEESSFPLVPVGDMCTGTHRFAAIYGQVYKLTMGLITIHSLGE